MSNYSDSSFTEDPNTPWYKVLKLIPNKSKLLDVGCSSGNFDEIIINRKKAVIDGIELNKEDAKVATTKIRKVFNLNVETDDLSALDKDYDLIYLGDVIEHLVHPSAVLKRLKGNLNKNGKVIFSIPNMAHISVRLMLLSGNFEYGNTGLLDKTHLHYYDKNEIERVFHEAGYKIERLDWVSRDIPKELLKKELSKLGLSGNEKFFKLASSLEAGAYQFVGVASPANEAIKVKTPPKISPQIDVFERHLADIKSSYEEDMNRLKLEQNQKLVELLNEINRYEQSLSWKITKPLRNISKFIGRGGQ